MENEMTLSIWIVIGIAALASISAIYFLKRNDRTLAFRRYIIDLCSEHNKRHWKDANFSLITDAYSKFLHKHSYAKMLYSFKKLNLETWFTEEEIKELNN